MNMKSYAILMVGAVGIITTYPARAEFSVVSGSANANQWLQSVGTYTALTFTEFPDLPGSTRITEQYAPLGVHFVDTDGNWIARNDLYPQDGSGLAGWVSVDLRFDSPMRAFAAYYPGYSAFSFYSGSQLIFSKTNLYTGGYNIFAGFTSNVSFDRVLLYGEPPNHYGEPDPVYYDNFYFSTVPAPSGALLLIAATFGAARRRAKR